MPSTEVVTSPPFYTVGTTCEIRQLHMRKSASLGMNPINLLPGKLLEFHSAISNKVEVILALSLEKTGLLIVIKMDRPVISEI